MNNSLMRVLSLASNTIGALGATSVFYCIFFFTSELFPTNMRNQALGAASLAGRFGGMLGPFMTDLAEISVWAPGALAGTLCVLSAILLRFLPETKSRELPHTIDDIKSWSRA
ncbi:hypothetical protein ACOMHN_022734 [Nucella lapillus]